MTPSSNHCVTSSSKAKPLPDGFAALLAGHNSNARPDRAALLLVAALSVSSLRPGLWTLLFVSTFAHAQQETAANAPACSIQPIYPLSNDSARLRSLATQLEAVSSERGCLKDASFHAYRGAVLVSIGRAADAVEPLERALLIDPDLPGAILDLAQALGMQGDQASASALLSQLRQRSDLPTSIRDAIDRREQVIAERSAAARGDAQAGWQSRWQLSGLVGVDSNLNNAPASTEVTLTIPGQGNVTLPLDPGAAPRKGVAITTTASWQGIKAQGESVWVLQGELRARQTKESDTGYQQADISASWLQAPSAPRQWVARTSASVLRFGGTTLLQAYRSSVQHQWEAFNFPWISQVLRTAGSCRPSVAAELEYRSYPSTQVLNGVYRGAAGGLICRADVESAPAGSVSMPASTFSVQLRQGSDRPVDDARAGGTYRRSEMRAQWEGEVLPKAKLGLQWSSTMQKDSEPYSILLGNVPRKIFRNAIQVDATWSLNYGYSLIGTAEAGRQHSNLPVFESRQRSLYLGIRRDLM